jgi:hypothetical protein
MAYWCSTIQISYYLCFPKPFTGHRGEKIIIGFVEDVSSYEKRLVYTDLGELTCENSIFLEAL